MYEVEAQESLAMLSTAIVEQACYDYIVLSEQITRYADLNNVKELNATLEEFNHLVSWFLSDDFRSISILNPKEILTGLARAVEKGETIHGIQK